MNQETEPSPGPEAPAVPSRLRRFLWRNRGRVLYSGRGPARRIGTKPTKAKVQTPRKWSDVELEHLSRYLRGRKKRREKAK